MNRQIALLGTFEVENYGDRLFPLIVEKELASRLPSAVLQLFSPLAKGEGISPIFQPDGSPSLSSADAIIIGGGDIISFSPHITPEYARKWHSPLSPHSACWAIPSLHRPKTAPLLWNAPGVPFPFTREEAPLVRAIASQTDYLCVRDELSKQHLRGAGVQEPIEVVPDTALLLPRHLSRESLRPIAQRILRPFQLETGEFIVFQMQSGLERYVLEATKKLGELSDFLKRKVLLLPIGYCHGDAPILAKVQKESKGRFCLIEDKLNIQETAALIAHAGCFIGTSLHGNITAFAYGIPHLIYNAANLVKLKGFSQTIQEPERLISHCAEIGGKERLLLQAPSGAAYKTLCGAIVSHFDRIAHHILHPPSPREDMATPHLLDAYLHLIAEHRQIKKQLQKHQSCLLANELVVSQQLWQRFRRFAASFRGERLWPLRLGVALIRMVFKNGKRIFRGVFKRLYMALENTPVKIVPLHEWHRATLLKGTDRSISHRIREDLQFFSNQPIISLCSAVCKANFAHLQETIDSVQKQYYTHWELLIASSDPEIRQSLEAYAQSDARIQLDFCPRDALVSTHLNASLSRASGAYIGWLSQGDTLAPDALYEAVRKINLHPEADLIYSDEDVYSSSGSYSNPFHKPDWCPDSFLSRNYISHFAVIKREIAARIGGFRAEFEGVQDYDFLLRATELTDRVFHIPKILYHRRLENAFPSSPATQEAGRRAIAEALLRRKAPAHVESNPHGPGCYTVRYQPNTSRKISIIIPTKDQSSVLKKCIDSIHSHPLPPNTEVLVVSNNSREKNLFALLEAYKRERPDNFRYYESNLPFNYSRLMNEAAAKAQGDLLLFLNNDTEVISPDWIGEMAGQAERRSIGVVGCKLLYFNNTIQHAGVIMGLKSGIALHAFLGEARNSTKYFNHLNTINNYTALTAACFLCRKEVFEEVAGFDESLSVSFNDIDFCLRLGERGYRHVYLPQVELYHHESLTRGSSSATKESAEQLSEEIGIMQSRWAKYLDSDPCYSMHPSQNA